MEVAASLLRRSEKRLRYGPGSPSRGREVVAETVQIQEEESKVGAVCSDIAARIHRYQVDAGVAEFIYHRPGTYETKRSRLGMGPSSLG